MITHTPPTGAANIQIITPDIGNINHHFTHSSLLLQDKTLLVQLPEEKIEAITGYAMIQIGFYLKGKPATKKFEEEMLNNGELPQRIGHRIYYGWVLEAQNKLQQATPHLFEGLK